MKIYLCCILSICQLGILFCQPSNEIAKLTDSYAQHERLSGSILVKQANEIIYQNSYGWAQVENEKRNTAQTAFNIASLSKQFTAAGILYLVAEGAIDLDTSINKYLGKHASPLWKKVTVHHLLSHTSGIPSLMQFGHGLDDVMPSSSKIGLEQLIDYFKPLKLRNKPGKRYRYNNSGYVLLAAIIEEVSKLSYGDFMQQKIFDQYGLENTSHGIQDSTQLAYPYYNYTKNNIRKVEPFHHSWLIGAGSIYSSVEDMAKWIAVIHSSEFLNPTLRKLYFKEHQRTFSDNFYSYGWEILSVEGKKYIHHDGTFFGYTADLIYEPATKILSIMLTNQTHETREMLGNSSRHISNLNFELVEMLRGKSATTLPQLVGATSINAVGKYQIENVGVFDIQQTDDAWKVSCQEKDLFDVRYTIPVDLDSKNSEDINKAIAYLVSKKYSKFAKYCNGSMIILTRLGIVRLGLNSITKDFGEWQNSLIYAHKNQVIYFRLFCTKGYIDFSVHINEQGKIKGLFDNNQSKNITTINNCSYLLSPTTNGFFVSGFEKGEKDMQLLFETSGEVTFQQGNRIYKAHKIN